MARWAARLGLAPRPSQTVYEYAGTLGDVLPDVRPDLETVARAKVEIAYGRRDAGPGAPARAARGHRSAACGLLRLVFRRQRGALAGAGSDRSRAGCDLRRPRSLERAAGGSRSASAPRRRSVPSGPRWSVRLWARRTGRPARISTTVMPHSSNGKHPEALERQAEQRQQRDLEDAVVADEDRPRRRSAAGAA